MVVSSCKGTSLLSLCLLLPSLAWASVPAAPLDATASDDASGNIVSGNRVSNSIVAVGGGQPGATDDSDSDANDDDMPPVPRRVLSDASPDSVFKQPLVVIRVAFSDQSFQVSDAEVAARIFADKKSVKHYFFENSYSRFNIEPVAESQGEHANDGVIQVQLDTPHPDFGNRYGSANQSLVRTVLEHLRGVVSWASFDKNRDGVLEPNELGVLLMVAGYEKAYGGESAKHPNVWAHQSLLQNGKVDGVRISQYAMFGERHGNRLASIGIICHELGHLLLNLPDLYTVKGLSGGVGRWGLMGEGVWNSNSGQLGDSPSHLLAWSKQQVGFVKPKVLKDGRQLELARAAVKDDVISVPLDAYQHGERLLLEYRGQSGYDKGLSQSNVLVTHMNDVDHRKAPSMNTLSRSISFNGQNGSESKVVIEPLSQGQTAQVSVSVPNAITGGNVSVVNAQVNALWGDKLTANVVMLRLSLPESAQEIHGVDVFSASDVTAGVSVHSLDRGNPGEYLTGVESVVLKRGWNRISLPHVAVSTRDVALAMSFNSLVGQSPVAVVRSARPSGKTWVQDRDDQDRYRPADFDVPAKLLYANVSGAKSASPAVQHLGGQSSTSSQSDGHAQSSGAGAVFVLLLLLFVPWRRSL